MTALVHQVVSVLPNNPTKEVSSTAWNQAHLLPGALGDMLASDGASGLNAIPQVNYNSATGSMNIGVDSGLGGGVLQIYDVQGMRGMFAFDATQGNLSADKLMPVTPLSGLLDLGGPANLWKDGWFGGNVTAATFDLVGGDIGGVWFVDGSGHAATSADFTFDAANRTVTIGGQDGFGHNLVLAASSGSGGIVALEVDSWDANDITKIVMVPLSGTSGFIGADNSGATTTPPISAMTLGFMNGVGGATPQLSFPLASGGWYMFADSFEPVNGNAQDLGFNAPFRTGYFGTSVVVGATPFTFSETAGVLQLGDPDLKFVADTDVLNVLGGILVGPSGKVAFGISDLGAQYGQITLEDAKYLTWDDGTDMGNINVGLNSSAAYPSALLLAGSNGDVTNDADLGAVGATVRSIFVGTSIDIGATNIVLDGPNGTGNCAGGFMVGSETGINDTITAASLAGKTITVTGGIITGFA